MILEYVKEAMTQARYERIEEDKLYYGEIPSCKGVWATGKTLMECKQNLRDVLESWLLVCIQKQIRIPMLNGKIIEPLVRVGNDKIESGQMA